MPGQAGTARLLYSRCALPDREEPAGEKKGKTETMDTDNYRKYKECSPEETIFRIQGILKDAGVFPVIRNTGEKRKGICSVRVTLFPTAAGTNGKGTDELYSTASGLAELMERLQNNALLHRPAGGNPGGCGFLEAPDEEMAPLEEVLANPDPFTRMVFSALDGEEPLCGGPALYEMYSFEIGGRRVLPVVPFADPANGRIVRVPVHPLRRFDGSNGMAAGNTMEEALVQGLSELLEREVNGMVLEGRAVPAEIPDEAVSAFSFFPRIRELRALGRYRVRLLDFSLGRGWPVAGLCITDLEKGTFGLRFGAHPSFPVALERTLTEAFQGRTLEAFASGCRVGSRKDACRAGNRIGIATNGAGIYPESLFLGEPGWTFRPWTRFQGTGNREFLRELLKLLKDEGQEPLFRDASFLGFPACQIVIPGFRTIRPVNGLAVRMKRTLARAAESWQRFPRLTGEEAERILKLIRFHEDTVEAGIAETLAGISSARKDYSDDRLGAYLSLYVNDYPLAQHYFGRLFRTEPDRTERQYYGCMRDYSGYRASGMDGASARKLVRELHPEEAAERACRDTEEPFLLSEGLFPEPFCTGCAACERNGNGCDFPEQEKLYAGIAGRMKRENVSQEALLELLRDLW